MYPPGLGSVVPFGPFHRFGGFSGVCRSFLKTMLRLDRAVSKGLNHKAVFSPAKFGSAARFSPPTQRRIVHLPPFPVGLENNSSFPLFSSSSFPPFRTIFPSLLNYWSFPFSFASCYRPFYYGMPAQLDNCDVLHGWGRGERLIHVYFSGKFLTLQPLGKSLLSC